MEQKSPARDAEVRRELFFDRHWLVVGSLIIVAGFAFAASLFLWLQPIPAVCVGGAIIMLFTAVGLNVLSSEEDMTTGEIQKSITLAVLYVFFGSMAFGTESLDANTIVGNAFENFWVIVASVVGFYFGSRIVHQLRTPPRGPVDGLLNEAVWDLQKKIRIGYDPKELSADVATLEKQLRPLVELQSLARRKS